MKIKIKLLTSILAGFALSLIPLATKAASILPNVGDLGLGNVNPDLPHGTITSIVIGLMKWLLGIFGLLGIIAFVISGIMYLMSAGNEDMQQRAKKSFVYAIVGVMVGLSGMVILTAVQTMLGGSNSQF